MSLVGKMRTGKKALGTSAVGYLNEKFKGRSVVKQLNQGNEVHVAELECLQGWMGKTVQEPFGRIRADVARPSL